jgi:hypothetical protein
MNMPWTRKAIANRPDPIDEAAAAELDEAFERDSDWLTEMRAVAAQLRERSAGAVDRACTCVGGASEVLANEIDDMRNKIVTRRSTILSLQLDIEDEESAITGLEARIAEHEFVIREFAALSDKLTEMQSARVKKEEAAPAEEPVAQ